jgi:hypothetical protein
MSPQSYVFPASPSRQVKAVQDYMKYVSVFDINNLSTLIADSFTQTTLPSNLGVPVRTKDENFAVLEEVKGVLDGKMDVSKIQKAGSILTVSVFDR